RIPQDRREQVVEVVRHLAGDASGGLEPLGALELLFHLPALGDVGPRADDLDRLVPGPVDHLEIGADPAGWAVRAPDAVLVAVVPMLQQPRPLGDEPWQILGVDVAGPEPRIRQELAGLMAGQRLDVRADEGGPGTLEALVGGPDLV